MCGGFFGGGASWAAGAVSIKTEVTLDKSWEVCVIIFHFRFVFCFVGKQKKREDVRRLTQEKFFVLFFFFAFFVLSYFLAPFWHFLLPHRQKKVFSLPLLSPPSMLINQCCGWKEERGKW